MLLLTTNIFWDLGVFVKPHFTLFTGVKTFSFV